MSAVRVAAVPVAEILPLRRAVLRAGLPIEESRYEQDDLSTTLHLAAYDDVGRVVGCSTWFPDPLDGRDAWRLRGMATAPEVRGSGVGARLVEAGLAAGAERGYDLVWCNARTPAVGFYERYGFEPVGEEFLLVHDVPHYLMVRELRVG
jgi:predicted GNAT family N-acyltransferase